MKLGTIEKVYLDDTDTSGIYKVVVSLQDKSVSGVFEAYPLNTNIKVVPVIGEQVLLFSANRADAKSDAVGRKRFYYSHPISIQNNINHNSLPRLHKKPDVDSNDILLPSLGLPNVSNPDNSSPNLGGDIELPRLSQLQPFLGDVLYEGRFGQSIRFGYTPKNTKKNTDYIEGASETPSWTSTNSKSPITIIRNTNGESSGYNKFIIEDVNEDDTSIWMTSKQKVQLKPSNGFSLGVIPIGQYSNPQLILNSDRVVINSKSDSVLISGAKSVNVSTPNWKADMDTIFSQLETTITELTKVAAVINGIAPGSVDVIGLTSALTQLQLMKQ